MPESLEKVAQYQPFEGVVKNQLFFDFRSDQRKLSDRLGMPPTTLNAQFELYANKPTIQSSVEMGDPTDPSLWHSAELHRIMQIYRNPKNKYETLI